VPMTHQADGYFVRVSSRDGVAADLLVDTGSTATTYKDTAVAPGTTYYYYVKAANTAGTGPQSNEASATAK